MSIIEKQLPFVKEQQLAQEKLAKKWESDAWRSERHLKSAAKFKELAEDLITLDANSSHSGQDGKPLPLSRAGIFLTLKDIEGLPEELIKELSFSDSDKLEFTIAGVIDEAGGVLSLDKILVGIYYKTQEILRRNVLVSRLFRMGQKGLIFSVRHKKGIYSTREISPDEAKKLFGQDDDFEMPTVSS